MSELMSYPGAAGLASASPGEVSTLASFFATVETQAQTSSAGLRGAGSDDTWTGLAADAFRMKLGKLPGDLANVQRSYGGVAHALSSYESQLAPLQSQFQQILTQIDSLQGNLSSAQGNLSSAQTNLNSATSAPKAKPTSPAVVNAHSAVQAANAQVSQLTGEIAALERRGRQLVDEFNSARGRTRGAISGAAGDAPHESWWSSALHAVGNFLSGAVVNIGKSVGGLLSGQAIIAFNKHPGWATLGTLVKDIAVTASLVALIAIPFAAPEVLEADGAALAGEDAATDAAGDIAGDAEADAADGSAGDGEAEGEGKASKSLGDYARGANKWGNRIALGANGGSAVTDGGSGHWGAAGLDVAFMAAPNLIGKLPTSFDSVRGFGDDMSNALHVGDSGVDEAADTVKGLQGASDSMSFYRFLRGYDVSPGLSERIAFSDGVPSGLKGVNLDDSSAIRAAASSANEEAAKAAARALYIGKPLAYGTDSLVVDPSHDAINHHYHLVPDDG